MSVPTSEVLNTAADLIEERGWTHIGESDAPWGDGADGPLCLECGVLAAAAWRGWTPRR